MSAAVGIGRGFESVVGESTHKCCPSYSLWMPVQNQRSYGTLYPHKAKTT